MLGFCSFFYSSDCVDEGVSFGKVDALDMSVGRHMDELNGKKIRVEVGVFLTTNEVRMVPCVSTKGNTNSLNVNGRR